MPRGRSHHSHSSRSSALVAALGCVLAVSTGTAQAGVPEGPLAEIGRIWLDHSPTFLAVNPDGSRLVVSGVVEGPQGIVDHGVVSIVDTLSNSVLAVVPLGPGFATGVAITPDGSRAYVAVSKASGSVVSDGANRLAVVDVAAASLVDSIEIGGAVFGPIGVVVSPNGERAYVSHRGSGAVFILDTDPDSSAFHQVLDAVSVGRNPIGLDVTPDGSRVYVALRTTSEVVVIDTGANTVIATIPVALNASGSVTSVAVIPSGARAYVTYASDSRFTAIDTDPASPDFHRVVATVDSGAGRALNQIAVSSDGTRAFIASTPSDELLVIDSDPASATLDLILQGVAVGSSPADVAYQEAPQAVAYVSNVLDGSVSIIGVSCAAALDQAIAHLSLDELDTGHRKALSNKFRVIEGLIERGNTCAASRKLVHDVLPKMDGRPSPPDWIDPTAAQRALFEAIATCLAQLGSQPAATCTGH